MVAHTDPESLFTSKDPKLNRNKQAALRIMRELLQCNQWERAGEWLTDRYIQHNPMAASGLKGVKNYFINVAKRTPTPTCTKLTSPVVAVQAEGDFVTVLAVREMKYADDPVEVLHHDMVRHVALRERQGRRALGSGDAAAPAPLPRHRPPTRHGLHGYAGRPRRDREADVDV